MTLNHNRRRRRCVCFGVAEWCAIIALILSVLGAGSGVIIALKNSEIALKERVTALEVKVEALYMHGVQQSNIGNERQGK